MDAPETRLVYSTAHQLQKQLSCGATTSEELTDLFLKQIESHNVGGLGLRAVIDVRPRDLAMAEAKALDAERRQGHLRSDLHGIPILLKVNESFSKDPLALLLKAANQLGCYRDAFVAGDADHCWVLCLCRYEGEEKRGIGGESE